MSDIAISVENLGKAYRIGLKEEIPDSLVAAAIGWAKAPLRNLQRLRRLNTFSVASESNGQGEESDIIWALKDVSFDVKRGEVVGIIGRNGAGKSTLLKILSRITEPTTGRAVIQGRVSSLLEVGTGFHPELSGRENVYMNGTILGMTKREIDRKFDEIVEFSGVEKFLDTPVKRYSSGMKVRLAFAVAAHLEPEILIIDEVLAVGDAEFQKKCLGKMQDVADGGRTVLFVSHNMLAVSTLCGQGILLQDGTISFLGGVSETVRNYQLRMSTKPGLDLDTRTDRGGSGQVRFVRVSGWAIIQPLFSMIVFTIVFGKLAKIESDGVPYAIFSFAALVPWTYFSNALTEGTNSLVQNSNMLSKVYFPRLILPMAGVISKLVDFSIAMVILGAMMVWFGIAPTLGVLALPLLILVMMISAAGLGMWLTALAIQYRDVKYGMSFAVQLMMYACPVIYPTSLIPEQYQLFYAINPMVGVIEGFRSALLGTRAMPWDLIGVGATAAIFIALTGALYFRSKERIFADVA